MNEQLVKVGVVGPKASGKNTFIGKYSDKVAEPGDQVEFN